MKKIFSFLFFFCIGIFFFVQLLKSSALVVEEKGAVRPARIMLFTCQYGLGHKMATQSILESLPECEIQVVDIYNEPLVSLDPMRSWMPELSNERIYNDWIKKENNFLLNLAGKIAPKIVLSQQNKIKDLLVQFISKNKPDLLISCVPLVNSALLRAANESDVPLLVITTDIDISAFCYGLPDDLKEDKSHFCITVPYHRTEWDKLFACHFTPSLRSDFKARREYR